MRPVPFGQRPRHCRQFTIARAQPHHPVAPFGKDQWLGQQRVPLIACVKRACRHSRLDLGLPARDVLRKPRLPRLGAQKDRRGSGVAQHRMAGIEPGKRIARHQRPAAPERQHARPGGGQKCRRPFRRGPQVRRPSKPRPGKGKACIAPHHRLLRLGFPGLAATNAPRAPVQPHHETTLG